MSAKGAAVDIIRVILAFIIFIRVFIILVILVILTFLLICHKKNNFLVWGREQNAGIVEDINKGYQDKLINFLIRLTELKQKRTW